MNKLARKRKVDMAESTSIWAMGAFLCTIGVLTCMVGSLCMLLGATSPGWSTCETFSVSVMGGSFLFILIGAWMLDKNDKRYGL